MNNIVIVDYEIGNHQSVANAVAFLGYDVHVSKNKEDIAAASAYILPGVGAFGEAMKNLDRLGLIKVLEEQVLTRKKPILGICLGMQLFADYSEENGTHDGFGWIKGAVVKLQLNNKNLRIPHVGWSNIEIIKKEPLFSRIGDNANFYFDHSYHFKCQEESIVATCPYGIDIVAAVQKDNIFGVQFHPEKSQNNGLKLFRSFFDYVHVMHGEQKQYA